MGRRLPQSVARRGDGVIGGRLAIGSAQFVLGGGVASQTGQASPMHTQVLLRTGSSLGVDTVDTSVDYGKNESLLGRCNLGAGIS